MIIEDEVLSNALNGLYNGWFLTWRKKYKRLTKAEFSRMMQQLNDICEPVEEYPIVRALAGAFLAELIARQSGGYTPAACQRILTALQMSVTE